MFDPLGDNRLACEISAKDTGLSAEETRTYRVIALNKQNDDVWSTTTSLDKGLRADEPVDRPFPPTSKSANRPRPGRCGTCRPAPKGLTVEPAKDSNIRTRVNRGVLVYWNARRTIPTVRPSPTIGWSARSRPMPPPSMVSGNGSRPVWLRRVRCSTRTVPTPTSRIMDESRMYRVAAQNAAGIGARVTDRDNHAAGRRTPRTRRRPPPI